MTAWWQSILRFSGEGVDTSVVTPWYRDTYVPATVLEGDRGLFLLVEPDLLGDTVIRFAVLNGYAHYRVQEVLPEIWDDTHTYGFTSPVAHLRLSKARKAR